jgi:hypothetical protein
MEPQRKGFVQLRFMNLLLRRTGKLKRKKSDYKLMLKIVYIAKPVPLKWSKNI